MLMMMAKEEEVEHSRFHALMQSIISKEHGPDAYREYLKSAFPGLEAAEQERRDEAAAIVAAEAKKVYKVMPTMPLERMKMLR